MALGAWPRDLAWPRGTVASAQVWARSRRVPKHQGMLGPFGLGHGAGALKPSAMSCASATINNPRRSLVNLEERVCGLKGVGRSILSDPSQNNDVHKFPSYILIDFAQVDSHSDFTKFGIFEVHDC